MNLRVRITLLILVAALAISCESTETPTIETATLSTEAVSEITTISALSGGLITDDGGAAITQRGICWGTGPSPTTDSSITSNGRDIGFFNSQLTGLERGTEYFVRAYAINSEGTSYGQEVTFSTEAELPFVQTSRLTGLTAESALAGGDIYYDGGGDIIQRGVCWSTSPSPSTDNDKTSDGTGDGLYESQMTGLELQTKYYYRAYAINSRGTSYGEEMNFTTKKEVLSGTFVDARDNVTYKMVKIGSQIWMAENLKASVDIVDTYNDAVSEPNDGICGPGDVFVWDNTDNDLYGKLYSWEAALIACPSGWHLPSDEEWATLLDFLVEDGIETDKQADALKTFSWYGVDYYDFTALPGGMCSNRGGLERQNGYGHWWTSTASGDNEAYYRSMLYNSSRVPRSQFSSCYGYSVRCVMDQK